MLTKHFFIFPYLQGYNVLWSDADIVWFENLVVEMFSFADNTIAVQSNDPEAENAANSRGRFVVNNRLA